MEYTLVGRLRNILKSKAGTLHLLRTWRFALSEALRSASGKQVNEILHELSHLSKLFVNTDKVNSQGKSLITNREFDELAATMRAGKISGHSKIYSGLHLDAMRVRNILEIGIGTNDPRGASSMGSKGVPGASLKLWTAIFPNAQVFGADIDPKSFVLGPRYDSLYVNSTDYETLISLRKQLEERTGGLQKFDLVIDDGLHTPESNLRTFRALMPLLGSNGYYVIEDISPAWTGFWKVIGAALTSLGHEVKFHEATEFGLGSSTFMAIKQKL